VITLAERTTNNFRFPGQYFIEETGLYYNWWRWYKSEVGRYNSKDPVESFNGSLFYSFSSLYNFLEPIFKTPLGSSLYQYVESNPIIYWDKSGLMVCKIVCGVTGVLCSYVCYKVCNYSCIVTEANQPICNFICSIIACNLMCGGGRIACKYICDKKEECKKE